MKNALIVIFGLALVASIIYGVIIARDKDALTSELESVQSTLSLTQSELDLTKEALASTQEELGSKQEELNTTTQVLITVEGELEDAQDELEDTQEELEDAQEELEDTQEELEDAQEELKDTQEELEDAQDELEDTQEELDVAQETLAGLGITLYETKECYDAELIDNPEATNPTWSQLMAFLNSDKTDRNTYIENAYDCSEFSRDVHNNAEAAGIRAAVVHIYFRYKEAGHALNAFLTPAGLVYVDCTSRPDKVAYVKRGKDYKAVKTGTIGGVNLRDDSWWNELSEWYGDPTGTSIVSNIEIFW